MSTARLVLRAAIACTLTVLATPQVSAAAEPQPCDETREVPYFNSDLLDASLEASIVAACPAINITVRADMDLNTLPARLDRWLVTIVRNGGTVAILPVSEMPVNRSIPIETIKKVFTEAWAIGVNLRDKRKQRLLSKAAGAYNVTLFVDDVSGNVTSVVLERKAEL